jgi:hypothetical protein
MDINGQDLKINPASFADAMALKRAIARAFKKDGVDLGDINVNEIKKKGLQADLSMDAIGEILTHLIEVVIDEDVESALFKCSSRCVIGSKHVNRDFFEDLENRQYYYEIMLEVAKANLSPFFKKAGSMFTAILGGIKSGQKSK